MIILAQPAATDAVGTWGQYGVLGLVAAGLIWFAKGAHQREKDRSDRLEQENQRLNNLIADRVIPVLTTATQALERSAELLSAVQREREQQQLLERRNGGNP